MNSQVILILAAIATVYIVLGVLYESYVHPLTILPRSAGVGAAGAGAVRCPIQSYRAYRDHAIDWHREEKRDNDGRLCPDAQRNGNLTPDEAIFRARLLRFRPIMMTTLAALFGALPLVISGGDGSELRQPLGITIVGGPVMSQLLTLHDAGSLSVL